MRKIEIFINDLKFEGELNDSETSSRIYSVLPLKTKGNFWGEEIYFEIPVKMGNEKPTEDIKVGDLAYWPDENCLCIFYGRTPASTDGRPKPASPVTIIGKIKGELSLLKNLAEAKIKITQ